MRVAVLVLSLLATAAARPHIHPLHRHRDLELDIVRRANETSEEKPGPSTGPVVTTTDETDTPATTTPVTPSSTREVPPTTTTEATAPTSRHTPSEAPPSTQTPGSSTASTTDETSSNTPGTSTESVNPSSGLTSSTSLASVSVTSASSTVSTSANPSSALLSTDTSSTATQRSSTTTKAPIIVSSRTAKPSATSSSESSNEDQKSSGLPKAALIAIIVVASVIGLAGIIWTLFRKWKLRPSKNFDNRMKPIDFGPGHDDDFIEKSMHDRQRQEFVADLDMDQHHNNSLTAGIPDHDFTAGAAGAAPYNQYDPDPYEYDPYARASPYDFTAAAPVGDNVHPEMLSDAGHAQYDGSNHGHVVQPPAEYPAVPEPSHATYPPQPGAPAPTGGYYGVTDHPTQDPLVDDGYSNLQRGPSIGHTGYPSQAQPFDPYGTTDFSIAGRPTGGVDSPYAQAAAFRY